MRNILIAVVVMLLSQSCATMFSGTSYTADIRATKPGSSIYVNGELEGTDEVKVRQKRKDEMEIKVINGEDTEKYTVVKKVKWGAMAANLLNWYYLPVGHIVDFITGGIYQPEHKNVDEVTKIDNKNFKVVIENGQD